ncbi:MAG: hypothetical protein K5912_00355 [Alphaproteobacteria bacterium]|nr:hypothetical protein [Alphaproteobacteria bacterium]
MNEFINTLIGNTTQCWGCGIFDNLFTVVSEAGSAVYDKLAYLCFILFAVIFGFYVFWALWQHVNPKKPDTSDKMYMKTVGRVFISALFALTLLAAGTSVPRFVSNVTFEPVADMAVVYSHAMLNTNEEKVNAKVQYTPKTMNDDGIFSNRLKDRIVLLMKTTTTQFQSYMGFGAAIMEKAFDWSGMFRIGGLLTHLIIFIIGLFVFYNFFKLFLRFCFYFVDVIVAMGMFAFFFPVALMLFAFRGAPGPNWLSGLGKGLGTDQIKNLINAIVTLVAVIITYTVMNLIISRFFVDSSEQDLMRAITSGDIFSYDLSDDKFAAMSLGTAIVLIYVFNFLYEKIPEVSKMILSVFGVSESKGESEKLAADANKLFGLTTAGAKTIGSMVVNHGQTPEGEKSNNGGGSKESKPTEEKK